jgi:hypothetical protein
LALSQDVNATHVPFNGSAVVAAGVKAHNPSVPPPLHDNLFL